MLELKTPIGIRERKGTMLVPTGNKDEDSLGHLSDIDNDFGSLLADCDDFYSPSGVQKSIDKKAIMEDDPMHEFIQSIG